MLFALRVSIGADQQQPWQTSEIDVLGEKLVTGIAEQSDQKRA